MELNHRCLDVSQESCRWTTGLFLAAVDPPRVALGFPACGAGVFLLDHEPVVVDRYRPALGCRPGSRVQLLVPGVGIEPTILLVQSQASLPTATAPECVCHPTHFSLSQFGEEGSNLRLLIQSQAAYR